ncbi:ABC-three component system middle component 1 [Lactococcus lactis]|uniref:ABC-three component system middle component 1 n=1 Tax=Lactococcus lactis TaxID=1358 RepID=UPI0021A772AF|nr:ABC-three component system middle component 1 [Lactococcus lactis]
MMYNFIKQIFEKNDYHQHDNIIELWKNSNEFFILQEYDKEELQSSSQIDENFFTCEQTNNIVSEFEKIKDNKIKKNTSLFIIVKVKNLEKEYKRLKNITMRIEEDEYYFRKYVIFYTEDGLSKLNPDAHSLLDYIQTEVPKTTSSVGNNLFDTFEENMFFDDAYFIAMQLIIKLTFISLPHSDKYFETVEDKIKTCIELKDLIDKENQVNQVLKLFSDNNFKEKLEDETSGLLDNLNKILGE